MVAVDYAGLESYLRKVIRQNDLVYMAILDRDKRAVVTFGDMPEDIGPGRDPSPLQVDDGVYDVSADITLSGRSMGSVWLGFSLSPMQQAIDKARNRDIMISGIGILLTILATIVIGVGMTRRLGSLARAAQQVGQGDYSISVEAGIHDEIGQTARAFNLMVKQIEANQQRLWELTRRNELIFQNSLDGFWIVDVDGNIREVNDAYCRMVGYSHEELLSMNIVDVEASRGPADIQAHIDSILKKGSDRFETRHRRKDNSIVHLDVSVSLLELNGDRFLFAFFRDVTERKRMEEEIQRAQKLESLGVLAGGLAHDFNNLLTGILGNITMAKMYLDSPDKVKEKLEQTEKASIRASNLTQQLLAFSKGGVLIKKTTSIGELIRESSDFALRGSNVKCLYNIPDDLWPLEVDEGQMNQVINNLIINADQSMPEGGTIHVSCKNVFIRAEDAVALKEGEYVKISIKDEGTGIPEEHLQRIFDPYFSTKQKGSGLGLASVYSIVKRHNGLITVESRIGAGTTFHIYLPASHKEIVGEGAAEKAPLTGKGRILIMDDEEIVREVAGEMLRSLGYEAEITRDGEGTIALYQERQRSGHPFDAVILDLTIPGGMGGKEAIQRLHEIDPRVKAIVSSGYSSDPIMSQYREYGFKGVVRKPYKIQELAKALHEVLTGE